MLRKRVDLSATTAILAAGDLVAIAAFVLIGAVYGHGESVSNVGRHVGTFLPFLIGWLLATLLGSLYTTDARRSILRAVSWTIPAWITAALIGQVLRASSLFHGSFSPIFLLISILVGLALLVPWRAAVAYWLGGGTLT
ncbi:putative membrane protein [Halorhabdus sp. SVX81]|nr:putative membrane protein [Halorhabdus sp. SVX81]WEL22094.1 putative membrane protein [Halorhabdus sp. BNX81]